MSNTEDIKSKLPAIAKPPADRKKIDLRPFNRFVQTCDQVLDVYEEYARLRADEFEYLVGEVEETRDEWGPPRIAQCREGLKQFDGDDRYDRSDNEHERQTLKESFVTWRLGKTLASIPSANSGSPEDYVKMLVAHVSACDDVDALSLESACREIELTAKGAPRIPQMLEMVEKHATLWRRRKWAIGHFEQTCNRVIDALQKAEAQALRRRITAQRNVVAGLQQQLIEAREREAKLCTDLLQAKLALERLEQEEFEANAEPSADARPRGDQTTTKQTNEEVRS